MHNKIRLKTIISNSNIISKLKLTKAGHNYQKKLPFMIKIMEETYHFIIAIMALFLFLVGHYDLKKVI